MPTKGPGRKSGKADRPKTKRARQARADAAHARRDEAHAREDEAHARKDEAHARKDEAHAEADEAQAKAGGKAKPDYTDGIAQSIFRLSEMLGKDRGPDGSSLTTDAVTQALLLVLGSAPAVATVDNMLAVQAANGMMYFNAVANQQKTNMLGMAMTAKCVRHMLDPHPEEVVVETSTTENA